MVQFSGEELERRRVAEAGFWKEMEERGLSRADVLMYWSAATTRLDEIRRGLITQADIERRDKRVDRFLLEMGR